MKDSAIQWTDHTFNAWEGCTKVAPECKNCYAEVLVDKRFGRAKWGKGQPRRRTSEQLWKQPIIWNRDAEARRIQELHSVPAGQAHNFRRTRVFCLSLGDWLDEEVPIEWLADLLNLISDTPNLDWQLLTKRPQNWIHRIGLASNFTQRKWLFDWAHGDYIPENIWIGVSAGADQKAALDIPAKIHFLSCEPMLHALDRRWAARFDWIIFGGESGKSARPCDVDWIREGVKFCLDSGVVPFVKQLGHVTVTHGITRPGEHWPRTTGLLDTGKGYFRKHLCDSHGGDLSEWPEDLRIREFPKA